MATLADSLVSSSARRLSLRMRPDLSARRHRYQGKVYWVVKEPIGLNYFRFQEEEYSILRMLDGEISLDEIKERFEKEFPPQKITVEEVQQFLGMLHRSGLIIADVPGQGRQLRKRRDERKRQELIGVLSNILWMRFKGFDPERFLNWLYPWVRWFFSPWFVAFCCFLGLTALSLVTVEFEVFRSKLPTFYQFFNVQNAFLLAAVLGVTKVLHEFGHGLTCKHFGGECHEMGIMLLVLTPCLYCNVSDSWMLPNKWHRAAIGVGGMYVEMVIASIATFVWWFSSPGMLNSLALNTIFVCSVSTVLFNGNPLLRYDGYYILADIMEIPNLRQKSSTILSRKLGAWCLGLEEHEDPFLPKRNQIFFALYTVASAIYRWIVVFSILFFLYKIFEPYGLKVVGQAIAMAGLVGLVFQPLWKLGKFFYVPGRIENVKKPRMYATLGILATLVLAFLFVPLPYRVICMLEIKPRDALPVYVDVAGKLDRIDVQPGQRVTKGATLGELSNLDVNLAVEALKLQRDQYKAQLESLERQRFDERRFTGVEAGSEIATIRKSLAGVEEQLRQKQMDLTRLRLVAPIAGTVLPPPEAPKEPDTDGQLPRWYRTPLDPRNLGATLMESTLFCQIGEPEKMEANLVIDQSDIEFIQAGQPIDIKLDEMPHDTLKSTISEIGPPLKISPKQLSNKGGGELASKTDPAGVERPASVTYQARAPLDNAEGLLRIGLRGRAKVHARWQTLGQRTWRYITQTFNFRL
ncbi:MAG: hemolysin D [Pirellulales bacterium]